MIKIFLVQVLLLVLFCEGQSQDLPCDGGKTCMDRDSCESFISEQAKLKQLRKGTSDYRTLLTQLRKLICNKKGKKVCCRKGPPISNERSGLNDSSSPVFFPNPLKGECGLSGSADFILGGEDSELGEFPWMVLLRRDRPRNRIWWHCGGALINKWFVITAAHCGPSIDHVRVGDFEIVDENTFNRDDGNCRYYNSNTERQCQKANLCFCEFKDPKTDCVISRSKEVCSEEYQDIEVEKRMTHPSYTTTRKGLAINDIMLLKLKSPVTYNKFVKPVCLPTLSYTLHIGEQENNKGFLRSGKVVGWGQTYTDADDEIKTVSTARQQKLKVPFVSNEECIEKFKDFGANLENDLSIDKHLCAGGQEGKDSCKGDSGGPLIAQKSTLDPFLLVGVVSGGTSRCGIGAPGIFTRVTDYLDWIKTTMQKV